MTDAGAPAPGRSARAISAHRALVVALTDYGAGPYAALLQAAVRFPSVPTVNWLDLSHSVPMGDIRAGALTLRRTLPELPPCVCVAVVDPGVGTERRAVALVTGTGHLMVGPDNGLLEPATRRLGGVGELVNLGASPLLRTASSRTFAGRDLFGPVAGALAAGASLREVGAPADPRSLVVLALPGPHRRARGFDATVLEVDHFGTLVLALDTQVPAIGPLPSMGSSAAVIGPARTASCWIGQTFADVPTGALVLYRDSDAALALACRDGSAAERLGVHPGDALTIEWQASEDPQGPEAA